MNRLLQSQSNYLLGLVFLQSADQSLNGTQISGPLLFYYYALLVAQYATTFSNQMRNHSVYQEVGRECRKQREVVNVLGSTLTGGETAAAMGIGVGIVVGIVIIVVLCVTYRDSMPPFLANMWRKLGQIVPSWLKTHWSAIFNIGLVAIYALNTLLNIHLLYDQRALILKMNETKTGQETNWGYGQTTAIVVWLPFFYSAAKETMSRCYLYNPPLYTNWNRIYEGSTCFRNRQWYCGATTTTSATSATPATDRRCEASCIWLRLSPSREKPPREIWESDKWFRHGWSKKDLKWTWSIQISSHVHIINTSGTDVWRFSDI